MQLDHPQFGWRLGCVVLVVTNVASNLKPQAKMRSQSSCHITSVQQHLNDYVSTDSSDLFDIETYLNTFI